MSLSEVHESATTPLSEPARERLLEDLTGYVRAAWQSFEHPRPAEPHADQALLARLEEPLPTEPSNAEQTLADAVEILEASVSPARPLYLAYIGSTGLEAGVLASTLSATYDVNLATAAGAADALDAQAVRWMGEFVGYPVAEGHFTSGGQTSNLTAILAAREQALPGTRERGLDGRKAAVYCSEEAHHSVLRAVEAAGLGRQALRKIAIRADRTMDVEALAAAIEADRAAGVTPIAVVATGGTTLTGAVDPIGAIAEVCERESIWLHVDGAFGLPAAASRGAGFRFAGLDRADSVTIDAHKWMGVQKSCSLIMLRRSGPLLATFGHDERYMLHEQDSQNPVDRTFEYSRPFRSLRLWLAFRLYGADRYRDWIDHTLDLGTHLAELVRDSTDFELLHDPQLSTVCFRHRPNGLAESKLDELNRLLAQAFQRDGRVFLAPAVVDGVTCLRVCFVNYRTEVDAPRFVLEVARELARDISC